MWIIAKSGFVDVVRSPNGEGELLVRSQERGDLEHFVAMLNEDGGRQHAVKDCADGDYRFMVSADQQAVAQVVTRLLMKIDYTKFKHSVFYDFGQDPHCILSFSPAGVQLSKLQRDQ